MLKRTLAIPALCLFVFTSAGFGSGKADTYYKDAIKLHGAANLEKIFELYARSAELGHPVAQYNLAMMYSNGESVYVDYQQAVYWFKKSAIQEFAPAQYRLGEMYYFEKGGLPRDLEKAVALFKQAAVADDPDAQMNLAMLLGTGEGLPQDTEKALFWMMQAREGGSETARHYHNMLMKTIDGKFTTDQRKRYWAEKAVELGIRETQQELRIPESDL